jgi:hypothetical protein
MDSFFQLESSLAYFFAYVLMQMKWGQFLRGFEADQHFRNRVLDILDADQRGRRLQKPAERRLGVRLLHQESRRGVFLQKFNTKNHARS